MYCITQEYKTQVKCSVSDILLFNQNIFVIKHYTLIVITAKECLQTLSLSFQLFNESISSDQEGKPRPFISLNFIPFVPFLISMSHVHKFSLLVG